ncbi:C15 family peptidase [Saccharothrix variisporea]|uniref:Pyrrolidone-carboxylate peptidase n=1 Tax=Saccharothrix variisporea TaxID=543527 RepID=A0A495XCD8_9PSEU|nr:hypothetical protein [Saccharothrix variisporea]RKT71657.1 pyrrolidone-carboxylate peptidase [Saccharothrix variisporea]
MIRRMRSVVVMVVGLGVLGLPAVASAEAGCFDPSAPLTVEEQRLDDALAPGAPAVGPELVRLGGFEPLVRGFAERLCAVWTRGGADTVVAETGRELWRAAVDRAREEQAWDAYDDRPLYWARLHLTSAVRQWQPRFGLSSGERAALVRRVDRASRGVDDVRFGGVGRRVLVTGFDPFQLSGTSVRRSNPAGAAALRLDGAVVRTPDGPARVEAAVLPVLWGSFDEGIVERFYGTAIRDLRPDALVTVSQGRPGRFDVERWAARWRGGFPDNNDIGVRGTVPDAAGWPQPALEFIETTLPWQRMVDAGTTPFPVNFNRSFCEWPLGTTPGTGTPSCRTDEPTPGAVAASGSGGDYLSNESMYRANRVRLGLGSTAAGGHLHTPVLRQPVDPTALTDAAFEAERRSIADQVRALVSVV